MSVMKLLRNIGLYLGHLLTALIGTAIITSPIWKLHRPSTVYGCLWQEIITGFTCAGLLGLTAARISKSRMGAWVWVAGTSFFMLHVISTLSNGSQGSVLAAVPSMWARIFGFDCLNERYVGRCWNFFKFTVPLVRTVAYSLGAFIASRAFAAGPQGHDVSAQEVKGQA
jgi:hypothetical protein